MATGGSVGLPPDDAVEKRRPPDQEAREDDRKARERLFEERQRRDADGDPEQTDREAEDADTLVGRGDPESLVDRHDAERGRRPTKYYGGYRGPFGE
jgi:hypothetical protein